MKSKVVATIFVLVFGVMQLTACGFHKGNTGQYKTPSEQAEELQTKIMDCFVNKDKDNLRNFFSEYTLNHCPDIEEQIEEAFALIDRKIVSYDEPFGDACGGFDDKSYGADTSHIMTDKDKEYWIAFSGCLTSAEDESKVGVSYIKVSDMVEVAPGTVKDWDDYIVYIGTGY